MKNDALYDALRRGDPAENQPDARSTEEQKAALLARCAAEPITEPARVFLAAQTMRPRKMRWALPALAGAGALTAAALYGVTAWLGANKPASQTAPARIANASPRPPAAPTPRAIPSRSIAAQAAKKSPLKRRDATVTVSTPTGSNRKRAFSVKPLRQNSALSPVKMIVRASRKRETDGPRLIADAATSQATSVLPKTVEPVVERVIIEQDDTPAQSAPPAASVAITMNGRSESVIVSRAEPATN